MAKLRILAGVVVAALAVPATTSPIRAATVVSSQQAGSVAARPAGQATAVIDVGYGHACTVTPAATVKCWGSDDRGGASPPADLGTVTALSTGIVHSCAVTSAGGVRCWGLNDSGQGSPPADLGTVRAVSAGGGHTCAVTTAGGIRCWGLNSFGQAAAPWEVGPWTAVAAGYSHTCALTTVGGIYCWGYNVYGGAAPPDDLGPVTAIAAGAHYSCAVTTVGAIRCWGINTYGQAAPPADVGPAIAVSAGGNHSCAVTTAGGARCWGYNAHGAAAPPADLGPVTAVSAGSYHSCAVTTAGAIRCWGPSDPPPGGSFNQLAFTVGSNQTCGVTGSGLVRCWGTNPYGALQPPTDLGTVREVASGGYHACAVITSGGVRCWGLNDGVQAKPPPDLGPATALGLGPFGSCAVTAAGTVRCWGWGAVPPVPPSSLTGATAVTVGKNHACAVAVGRAVCWGRLDTGDPTPPSDLGQVHTVTAGTSHVCAVTSANRVRCWGDNAVGQGSPPADLGTVSAVEAGPFYTCAITTAGALRCWGRSTHGESVPPADLGPVMAVDAGEYHACALVVAGRLRCWGRNDSGQAGGVVITSPPPPVAAEGVAYQHSFTASASPGPATWSLQAGSLPPGLTLNASTGSLAGKPTTPGSYQGQVAASNEFYADALQSFSITVARAVPTITAVTNNGPVAEGTRATIAVSASHPAGDPLSYLIDCDGDGVHEIGPQPANTGSCTVTRKPSQRVRVRVTDRDGDWVDAATDVGVVNAAPVIDHIETGGPVGEGGTARVTIAAHDPGHDPLRYSFDCDGDGTEEVGPKEGIDTTCSFPRDGTHRINVAVVDPEGLVGRAATQVQVDNLPPVIRSVGYSGPVQEGDTVTVEVSASDPGGDPLTFAFDCQGDGHFEVGPQSEPSAGCPMSEEGTRTVRARVVDDAGRAAFGSTDIDVANAVPSIDYLRIDDPMVNEGGSTTVAVYASDPGGDPLRFSFDCDGDGAYEVGPGHSAAVACTFPSDGSYHVGATVTDDTGAAATAGVDVEVLNVAPVILGFTNNGPVKEGGTVTINAGASDPGGDPLRYSFDCDGNGNYEVGPQPESTAGCRFAVPDLYHVGVLVTDDGGASATAATDVRVLPLLADVGVTGTCAGPAVPTGTLRCSATVTNAGPDPARSPTLRLTLDPHLRVVDVSGDLACSRGDPAALTCTTAVLEAGGAGDVTYTVRVADEVGPDTTMTTSAAAASLVTDPETVNDRGAFTTATPKCTIDRRATPFSQPIVGTDAADVICGSAGVDLIIDGDGPDLIFALGGDDVILGGGGDDVVVGGDGNDRLVGGAGADRLAGNLGSDVIVAGPGDDDLFGGGGADVLTGLIGHDTADGGAGQDVCVAATVTRCELPPGTRTSHRGRRPML